MVSFKFLSHINFYHWCIYMSSFKSIIMWLWFSVLISLLPLVSNAWAYYTQPQHYVTLLDCFRAITANGELILICITLSGALMGEIIFYPQCTETGKIIIGGTCLFCSLFSIWIFVHIWISSINKLPKNIDQIFKISYILFIITFILGIATKVHTVHDVKKSYRGGC